MDEQFERNAPSSGLRPPSPPLFGGGEEFGSLYSRALHLLLRRSAGTAGDAYARDDTGERPLIVRNTLILLILLSLLAACAPESTTTVTTDTAQTSTAPAGDQSVTLY